MAKLYVRVVWLLPLAIYAGDAAAWGLYTHVYFAQLLIWAIPLADPRFRRAIRRFPELLLAGACLPDTALFSRYAAAPELATTHQWSVARRVLAAGTDDESRALGAGYSSHLLTDVIAHNHFVPAHERLWFDYPVLTHAACEWAMDAHVGPQLFVFPGDLLRRHRARLAHHAAQWLGCNEAAARRALRWLGNGETVLRATRTPLAVQRCACAIDSRISRRFDYYISETARRLRQIDRLIAGDMPAWSPDPAPPSPSERALLVRGIQQPLPLPQDLF